MHVAPQVAGDVENLGSERRDGMLKIRSEGRDQRVARVTTGEDVRRAHRATLNFSSTNAMGSIP